MPEPGLDTDPRRPSQVETIAILGAGRVGTALARTALTAGYDVVLAASAGVEEVELIAAITARGAVAATAAAAARAADLVVLAVPFHRHCDLPVAALAGRIVVDAMNHWAPVDGELGGLASGPAATSLAVQAFLPLSHVVKTLNHIGYHELEKEGRAAGAPGRRALGVAGDDPAATAVVAAVVGRLGYDAVTFPTLADGGAPGAGQGSFQPPHAGGRADPSAQRRAGRVTAQSRAPPPGGGPAAPGT